jgi:hypothetical protein
MAALMVNFIAIGSECPSAMFAQVGFLTCVSSDVMSQRCSLRKSTAAVWVSAGIWLDPQMYISMPREGGLGVK